MSDRSLRLTIVALAIAGTAIAGYLTYARFADSSIVCTTGGCETVQSSRYAEVAGVPVALGLVAYLLILVATLATSEVAHAAAATIAVAGAVFSGYLVYAQVALIGALCQWCLGSDVVISVLAAATTLRLVAARNLTPSLPEPGRPATRPRHS